MTPKPKSAIDLFAYVGDEQKFREAISWYEAVNPKPWHHDYRYDHEWLHFCNRCGTRKKKSERDLLCIDWEVPDPFSGSLGDLAWELRDKVAKDLPVFWDTAQCAIHEYLVNPKLVEQGEMAVLIYARKHQQYYEDYKWWWSDKATPCHWIIAALLAIEKGKKK